LFFLGSPTLADRPAALRRSTRAAMPPADPWVDLCAAIRRIQLLAADARAELGQTPRGRRAARVEQLVGQLDLAAQVAADLAAEAARSRETLAL
jgi:hypothetical protein